MKDDFFFVVKDEENKILVKFRNQKIFYPNFNISKKKYEPMRRFLKDTSLFSNLRKYT